MPGRVVLSATLLVAAFAAMGLAMGVRAQDDGIAITTDKTSYIDGTDSVVRIEVTGLGACSGQPVTVAIFFEDGSIAGTESVRTGVLVANDGSLATEVPVLHERSSDGYFAGVQAPCVPGGTALGEELAFLHGDPPFGPTLPAAPLPAGISIVNDVGEGVRVAIGGFPQCAGRRVDINLGTEAGGPVFDDSNDHVFTEATFAADGTASGTLSLDGVPAGRYITWIRSICTGTIAAPGVITVAGTSSPETPAASPAPRPPSTGNGRSDTGAGTGAARASAATGATAIVVALAWASRRRVLRN